MAGVVAAAMSASDVSSIERAIGRLQGEFGQMQMRADERHAELLTQIEHLHDCIEEVKKAQWTRSGMWKAAGLAGGGAAAAITATAPFLRKLFGIGQ